MFQNVGIKTRSPQYFPIGTVVYIVKVLGDSFFGFIGMPQAVAYLRVRTLGFSQHCFTDADLHINTQLGKKNVSAVHHRSTR